MHKARPTAADNIDLIGQLIIYVLDIYILHDVELLQTNYFYIPPFHENPLYFL